MTTRFFAWLCALEIVPSNKISMAVTVGELYTSYRAKLNKYYESDIENPTKYLNVSEGHIIIGDVDRSIHVFRQMASNLGIYESQFLEARLHLIRILCTLSKGNRELIYTQGYDRFAFIPYAICLLFSIQADLPSDFAEAISYYITRRILQIADINSLLANNLRTEDRFHDFDKQVAEYVPKVWNELALLKHTSYHFALPWQLVLFVDIHTVNDIILIWDHIIIHQNTFPQYIDALTLAHLLQIKPDHDKQMLEVVQNFRDWDTDEIIADADTIYAKERKKTLNRTGFLFLFTMMLVLLVASAFFYIPEMASPLIDNKKPMMLNGEIINENL